VRGDDRLPSGKQFEKGNRPIGWDLHKGQDPVIRGRDGFLHLFWRQEALGQRDVVTLRVRSHRFSQPMMFQGPLAAGQNMQLALPIEGPQEQMDPTYFLGPPQEQKSARAVWLDAGGSRDGIAPCGELYDFGARDAHAAEGFLVGLT
jgi:hypothetical protein